MDLVKKVNKSVKIQKDKLRRKNRGVSELRQDLVTGEWIAIAVGRGKRPSLYIKESAEEKNDNLKDCPFEDPRESGNEDPVLVYKNLKNPDWSLEVIPNKYPAFSTKGTCEDIWSEGSYLVRDGYGFHEVVITRDHKKHLALISQDEVVEVLRAYRERYNVLKGNSCVKYVSVFHNHGKAAGASIVHPHSQIIAIPVLPSDIHRSLSGSYIFYKKENKCVYCVMMGWELKDKSRIVFENNKFVAFCPFVSRAAFEIRIFPKVHQSQFENIHTEDLPDLSEVLREALFRLYKFLKNPSYNFFLHTAPADGKDYYHYHWHFEILPKTAIWAGFELGTGIEISTLDPKDAAKHLRNI